MIYLNPVRVKTVNKRLKVVAVVEKPLSKSGNKTTKVVNADYDTLPAAFDLFGLYLEKKEAGVEVVQVEKNTLGSKASITGILRALLVLKTLNPALYGLFVELAKLLSYEVDENFAVPPLSFLLSSQNGIIENVWVQVLERTGITKEAYARTVAEEFESKGLFPFIALFSRKGEEDRREVSKLLSRPVELFPHSSRVYSSLQEDLELILESLRREAGRKK